MPSPRRNGFAPVVAVTSEREAVTEYLFWMRTVWNEAGVFAPTVSWNKIQFELLAQAGHFG